MFKRHQGRRSETDLRLRRSLEVTTKTAHARSSEQIHRRPSSPMAQEPVPEIPAGFQAKLSTRFSLLRFRNVSDPAIPERGRGRAPSTPLRNSSVAPPPTPAIITTAPTGDFASHTPPKRSGTIRLWRQKSSEKQVAANSNSTPSTERSSRRSSFSAKRRKDSSSSRANASMRVSRVTFDEPERPPTCSSTPSSNGDLPAYGDQSSSLPLPAPRLSESSRSTASSGEHYVTTTTTQTTTTTTTFFKLRRKKKETSLFPRPIKVPSSSGQPSTSDTELTPQGRKSISSARASPSKQDHNRDGNENTGVSMILAGLGITGPAAPIIRSNSVTSAHSAPSSPGSLTPRQFTRGRSSTMSSLDHTGDGRTGKSSFGGLFGRIRRDSEPIFGPGVSRNVSPQPSASSPLSAVSQELVTIPERKDEDTPQMYLSKLFEAVSKSVVASLLARNGDTFHLAVLEAYMATFDFGSVPMDMALRKLLMEVELPSETQQIDRVLQTFADRYHVCNPFIYQDSGKAPLARFRWGEILTHL